jgi:hypothetical protein
MTPWMLSALADTIVAVHVVWVGVVVLAVPLIALGAALKWAWVKSFWFRVTHVAMIGVVVAESLAGVACPLTVWEQELRRAAGGGAYDGSFLGHWLHELLFFDFEPWVFTAAYVTFGILVAGLWWAVRPMRRAKARVTESAAHRT